MRKWNKPTFGILVLLISILFCVVFGSWRTAHAQYVSAEKVFYNGAQNDGIGVASDLSERVTAAVNLGTIAGKYGNPEQVSALNLAVSQCSEAQTINGKWEANNLLEQAFYDLKAWVEEQELSAHDQDSVSSLSAEFQSRAATMSHDAYNSEALEYNQILTEFPVETICTMLGLEPLELFR